MATLEQRVTALEARLAALESRPAEPAPKPAPARPAEPEGMTITTELPGSRFAMPTETELRALHRMVLSTYPMLVTQDGRFDHSDRPFDQFVNAFRALGGLGRSQELDRKRFVSWWVEHAQERAAHVGGSDISTAALVAAVVAHGDIPFRALDRFPYELEFGLVAHGGGRPAGDAWRRVLASGRLPAPVEGLMAHENRNASVRLG